MFRILRFSTRKHCAYHERTLRNRPWWDGSGGSVGNASVEALMKRAGRSASVICTMPPWSYGIVLFLATRGTHHVAPHTAYAHSCLLRRDHVRRLSHRRVTPTRGRNDARRRRSRATTNASVIPPSDICPEKVYSHAMHATIDLETMVSLR